MHFNHILAVVAADENEARDVAGQFLDSYGDGKVWDWYEVGGRWQGSLDGADILKYSDKPEVFKAAVEGAVKGIDREFRSGIRKMTGRVTTAEEIGELEFLGELTSEEQRKGIAERTTQYDQAISKNLAEVATEEDRNRVDMMAAYYLQKVANILTREYTSDAYFYDTDAYTTDPKYVFERCEKDPDHQFLVSVDLHN